MDEDEIRAANHAFYAAFEAGDIDAMDVVWERSERAVCIHPGWGMLRGWEAVRASFVAIFSASDEQMQFILTDEHIEVEGEVAWVTLDENLWASQVHGTVASANLFVRDPMDGRWRMTGHYGSPVSDGSFEEQA